MVDKHIYEGDDGEGKGEEVFTLLMYTSCQRHPGRFLRKKALKNAGCAQSTTNV